MVFGSVISNSCNLSLAEIGTSLRDRKDNYLRESNNNLYI